MSEPDHNSKQPLDRRDWLKRTALATAGLMGGGAVTRSDASTRTDRIRSIQNGNIRQVLVSWPYMNFGERWSLEELCLVAKELGCKGVGLLGPDAWPVLQKHGLTCAMATNGMPDPPFEKGLNNPRYQPEVIHRTEERIEACAEAGVSSVIAFTGFSQIDLDHPEKGEIDPVTGANYTVEGLKQLARTAERYDVTICMEHLNSRVPNDDNRGHPGYQGDDIDYCADIIRRVGSPRVKLLFDIYHVQIMNGDVIQRIRDYGTDLIGHIHTAGVPGRRELDTQQELYYPAIMEALLEIGYEGYVGQEFIPTRDPMEGLREAVTICDV